MRNIIRDAPDFGLALFVTLNIAAYDYCNALEIKRLGEPSDECDDWGSQQTLKQAVCNDCSETTLATNLASYVAGIGQQGADTISSELSNNNNNESLKQCRCHV